jgi:DNA-binding transcriptional ArsR family regulator
MELKQAADSFAALSQPSRLAVLQLLREAGAAGARPSQMATTLQLPANTLSFHLRQLRQAGLISEQRSGRDRVYRANHDALGQLLRYLGETAGSQNLLAPDPVSLAGER